MLVSFNPAITNNKYSQQTNKSKAMTFGEKLPYNQEWLNKIVKEPRVAFEEYMSAFLNPHNNISKEQYIATLKESLNHVKDGFKGGIQRTIDWAEKFNRAS